jgi:hypothetical protein
MSRWSFSVGGCRCPCAGGHHCLAGAGGDGLWWFGIIVRGWLLSVHGVGLIVHPWRGSLPSVSGGRGRCCL